MKALHIASWTEGAGKTSLCAAIARWLRDNGKSVGYLKPVDISADGATDSGFFQKAVDLPPSNNPNAFCTSRQDLKAQIDGTGLNDKVKQIFSAVSGEADIVLIEAPGGMVEADLAKASHQIAEAANAVVVMVAEFATDSPWDRIVAETNKFGKRLLGLVINRVPEKKMDYVRNEVAQMVTKKGIKLLAIMPENRGLMGVSVQDLAQSLEAKPVCCNENLPVLVENVMIGAMTPDSGADYFRRKDNKAVIARGTRPDIQLAALSTSTRCLVLTGDGGPAGQVKSWAEDKDAPIIVTDKDTLTTVEIVEQAFAKARFHQVAKLDILMPMMVKGFDFSALSQGLQLAG